MLPRKSFFSIVLLQLLFTSLSVDAQLSASFDTKHVVLDFTASQRGIAEELVFFVPASLQVDWSTATVDVIGRGAKTLSPDGIRKSNGTTKLQFEKLDLRPDNGADVRIQFSCKSVTETQLKRISCRWRMSTPVLPEKHQGARYVRHDARKTFEAKCQVTRLPKVTHTIYDARSLGLAGDGKTDDTQALNTAIERLSDNGGGIVEFKAGTFCLRSVHLLSHVWLHVSEDAVLSAIPGMDEPEDTWFADFSHNAGDGMLDQSIYDPYGNFMVKQDVGHSFFQNAMFWAVRQTDIRIYGSGRITGNGIIDTGNGVLGQSKGRRADKMFSFKLCNDIEIAGEAPQGSDLWYDEKKDEPFYLDGTSTEKMLDVDRGGHFVILATGTDNIRVHDIYAGRKSLDRARDIFDFMACSDVHVTNIFSKCNGDDIVKLGSDCSLGFTRKSQGTYVRNIIGDTNCNLFQIGSETADDITDVYVDNIYVLATNKAGFSISSNDGGRVSGVWLNSGRTGTLHSRSQMHRTRTPFFFSISNRGRVCGTEVGEYRFMENGRERHELLVKNHAIGSVENIHLRAVDCDEIYAGSAYYNKTRWQAYDGKQPESTPIFAGFKVPDNVDFILPDGRMTGYIKNVSLDDITITVKGGHPAKDSLLHCPEIGIGKFNIRDLEVQPSYGLWFRHVDGLDVKNVTLRSETEDGRPAVVLDDVRNVTTFSVKEENGYYLKGFWDKAKYPNAEPVNTTLLPEFQWKPGASNQPIGVARGIFPGRVVMARYPEAAQWPGHWDKEEDQWFLDKYTDAAKCGEMISTVLRRLTGTKNDKRAWQRIFQYYNEQRRGMAKRGYQQGERVAIKVNLNNSKARQEHSNMSDSTPQVILAMVRQLVNQAGVAPEDILIYDARRPIPAEVLTPIWAEFPDVVFLQDDPGVRDYQPVNPKTGDYSLLQKPRWTRAIDFSTGQFDGARLIPEQVKEATYLVNLAMLKLHSYPYNYMELGDEGQTAVTMTAKSHAGSVRAPWEMHHFLNTQQDGVPHAYSPLVDLNASPNLGAKTILFMLDGLYSGRKHATYPIHFPNAPFYNKVEPYENPEWPASILASLDEVALESVGLDLLYAQSINNNEPGFYNAPRILVRNNADDYLREMADPEHAPSGVRYVQDGKPVQSLGVFEHWDSPEMMRYSRNLDPKHGQGIEFIYIPMGSAQK